MEAVEERIHARLQKKFALIIFRIALILSNTKPTKKYAAKLKS